MCPPDDQDRDEEPGDDQSNDGEEPQPSQGPNPDALAFIRTFVNQAIDQKIAPITDAIRQLDSNLQNLAASIPTAEQVAQALRPQGGQGNPPSQQPGAPAGYPPRPEESEGEQPQGTLASLASRDAQTQLLMQSLAKFLEDPFGQLVKARQVFTGVTPIDPSKADLATIKAIANARPDEFAFVANTVMPDPMLEYMPGESAKAYRAGFESAAKAFGRKVPTWWNDDRDDSEPSHESETSITSTPTGSPSPQPGEYAVVTARRSSGRLSRALGG